MGNNRKLKRTKARKLPSVPPAERSKMSEGVPTKKVKMLGKDKTLKVCTIIVNDAVRNNEAILVLSETESAVKGHPAAIATMIIRFLGKHDLLRTMVGNGIDNLNNEAVKQIREMLDKNEKNENDEKEKTSK